jgi:hypothetical protein
MHMTDYSLISLRVHKETLAASAALLATSSLAERQVDDRQESLV